MLDGIDDIADCFLYQLDYYNKLYKCKVEIINNISLDVYSTRSICPDCEVFFANPWEELAESLLNKIKMKYKNIQLFDKIIHKNMMFTQEYGLAARDSQFELKDIVLDLDRENPRFWTNETFLKNRYDLADNRKKQYYLSRPRTYFVSEHYYPIII